MAEIKQKFERTYRTVTATKENPHMDDFMILDCDATGEPAKFVIHQGCICTDFAEIVEPALLNQDYFTRVREDFKDHPAEMPPKNDWVAGEVEIEPVTLLAKITDDQFEKMPDAVKAECHAHPSFQIGHFLSNVAKGRQEKADALLTNSPANQQNLLRTPGVFTDYSGRTFNCTAYEYAYWAKDTHMCRMLERHMDVATKAEISMRIETMERDGLSYHQQGQERTSAHFDLTPLRTALQKYIAGYDNWERNSDWDLIGTSWMNIGLAQRDVPAHVAQEYCRKDRSFSPLPSFNVTEQALPRILEFYNSGTGNNEVWYPLGPTPTSELGLDFSLIRASNQTARGSWHERTRANSTIDLAAVSHLDEVRDADLRLSREILRQTDPEPDHGMRV